MDGVNAFAKGRHEQTSTVKPIQYFIANLPPWLRYKIRYMLIHALIPAHLKGKTAKKYYDWLGQHEMSPLYRDGVEGVRVIVYGNTLDTPGRRELLNMQAVQAFYPCPHCLHSWQPGLRTQVYCGYRRFLPLDSPWRQRRFEYMGLTYQYKDVETRESPALRNDKNVALMADRGRPTRPFLGHKGTHFLAEWEGVDWEGNFCDKMHDYKLLCEMSLKGLVGANSINGMYKAWVTKKKTPYTDKIVTPTISSENLPTTTTVPRRGDSANKRLRRVTFVCSRCGGHTTWTHPALGDIRSGRTATEFRSVNTRVMCF